MSRPLSGDVADLLTLRVIPAEQVACIANHTLDALLDALGVPRFTPFFTARDVDPVVVSIR